MKFQFQLAPLAEVAPWGGDAKTLHWFGLTDGWFWVEVAGQELFRYSEAILKCWTRQYPEDQSALPYPDYPIVRYWEDLLDILPAVLDPVPDDLAERVADHASWSAWQERATRWMEQEDSEAAWDISYTALQWWSGRRWTSVHLSRPPRIWLWRTGETVHVRWDNRSLTLDDLPVWAAEQGEATLPVSDFQEAVVDFHARLMAAMEERVAEARRAWPFPNVTIDMGGLEREQRERPTWLEAALNRTARNFERGRVREAIAKISESLGA